MRDARGACHGGDAIGQGTDDGRYATSHALLDAAGRAVRPTGRRIGNCYSAGDNAKHPGMASDGGADPAKVQVTVLGSADAFCSGPNLNAAYLFETPRSTFLVDCGPTVLFAMKNQEIDTGRIDFVIISHLHGDHFAGLPFLLLEYMYERPRTRPLVVLGPPGIEDRVRSVFRLLYRDVGARPLPFELRFRELVPEEPTTISDVEVLPIRVPHQDEDVALAVRLDVAGTRILYSGDTPWMDRFLELARGADLFLCECTAYDTSMGRHIEFTRLQPLLSQLGCRRLVLMHLGREMRERAASLGVECATEGLVIRL
jgi:ribonuclease BN (tRNA processing enzyme)